MLGTAPRLAAFVLSASLTAAAGCGNHDGIPPIPGRLEFPISASLVDASGAGGDPTHLLVLNSNYYLTYNAAKFQSYDLATVESAIQSSCVAPGIEGQLCAVVPAESGIRPGRRGPVTVTSVQGMLVSEVEVGSFGDGIGVDPTARHIYLPIRAYEDLTHVRLEADGTLQCGQTGESAACADFETKTDHAILRSRDLSLPNEPLDVHVGDLSDFGMAPGSGTYVAAVHRTGHASFFVTGDPTTEPLVATDVVSFPKTSFQTLTYEPRSRTFWLPRVANSEILRASVSLDATSAPESATYAQWRVAPKISVGNSDVDLAGGSASLRQISFDTRVGTVHDGRFYLVAARPSALITGRVEQGTNEIAIDQLLPLGADPSRIVLEEMAGRMVAFVTCYSGREIYAYDVDNGRLLAVIGGLNGPFEIVLDNTAGRSRLIVVDFRVSVLRFYDLEPLVACLTNVGTPTAEPVCSPKMMGMLGVPSTVEELR